MKLILPVLLVSIAVCQPVRADFETGVTKFERGDLVGAVQELEPTAHGGDARAQYLLGAIHLTRPGQPADVELAASWLTKAAEQGHLEAQVELARLYKLGLGVPQNLETMVKWYEAAAEQGHVGAQLLVADAYAYGEGVEPDLVQAYVWYEIAMEYWGDLTKNAHDMVASQLTPEQIEKARRMAAERQKKGRR